MASWSALVVDDDAGIRQSLRLCLEADDARVLGVGTAPAALEALDRARFDVVLLDLWLGKESGLDAIPELLQRQPELAIVVVTAYATFESAVEAMKRGACDYLPKPFTPDQVRASTRRALESVRLRRRLADAEHRLAQAGDGDERFETDSPAFRTLLKQAARAAATDVPILLRGESGTGKNVLARWLWQHGARRNAPFVSVSCSALPVALMVGTLFGHRRGAGPGATSDAAGKVAEAAGGTLLLDEVGELSLDAQARLLRLVGEGTYERLGETRERRADVRLIAATNRSLEDEVRAGRFREDLRFRLDVVALALPALRERPEDLRALAGHFLARAAGRQHRPVFELSEAALRALAAYAWPGNLRELRNAVERAVILCPGPRIEPSDLGIPPAPEPAAGGPAGELALGAEVTLEAIEREHIARIVARAPTLEAAARTLGIDASTLQRKRKRYGLT
jgi:NtrC-family two-component system response regulator AlgB